MANPSNPDDVARWAAGITLGLTGPVQNDLDTSPYFATDDHCFFYASVFNQATAYQIQKNTVFTWKCCINAKDLAPIQKGNALVTLVRAHLVQQPQTPTGALWHVGN